MPRRRGKGGRSGCGGRGDVGAENSIGFVVEDAGDAGEVMSMDLSVVGSMDSLERENSLGV
jgi:hypothetical protein